ncbi:hypothetical protein [Burkholderia anthina]|uniref:hypothetical protein n=1 Tax=Burkholderia anthina TaxID=179879 RepID=UPI0037C0AD5A
MKSSRRTSPASSRQAPWFLARWFETARDPHLKAVYRQRAEIEDELGVADLGRCCVGIGDAFGLARVVVVIAPTYRH